MIIDATANPKVFNLLAAVARTAGRPMVWLDVYGGGIGGMVARSRPGLDLILQVMRSAYLQYCSNNPDPVVSRPSGKYMTAGQRQLNPIQAGRISPIFFIRESNVVGFTPNSSAAPSAPLIFQSVF